MFSGADEYLMGGPLYPHKKKKSLMGEPEWSHKKKKSLKDETRLVLLWHEWLVTLHSFVFIYMKYVKYNSHKDLFLIFHFLQYLNSQFRWKHFDQKSHFSPIKKFCW